MNQSVQSHARLIFTHRTETTLLQVVEILTPQRDRLDAVLIFPSMPEVMRLNKVGSFTMANLGQSKSVIGEFMKKKKKENGSSFEEGMLKLLRTLPKVLKFLPSDKAKDARSFMMSFQYWLGGNKNLITPCQHEDKFQEYYHRNRLDRII